jgi:hypothetical protein
LCTQLTLSKRRNGSDLSLTVRIKQLKTAKIVDVQEIFKIEQLSTCRSSSKEKRVHLFKRKANEKTYMNPRLILGYEFMDLVRRKYCSFRGRAVHKWIQENEVQGTEEGDVILLFFPDVP